MKKIFYSIAIIIIVVIVSNKTIAQNANTSLSNLTSPVKVNQNLSPKTTNAYSLGAGDSAWKNIFLTGSLYLDNQKFINNNGTQNTFIGAGAAHAINGASNNVANGFRALYSLTTGNGNVANGSSALYSNTTGLYNTATGYNTLYSNTTGNYNTANGDRALYFNSTGSENTAIGDDALYYNTTGYDNAAFGYSALSFNTSGHNNTAAGLYSLESNTTGYNNTAAGSHSALLNTTGHNNIAIGTSALHNNKTGSQLVAIGDSALFSQNGGSGANTAVGYAALYTNSTGSYNTSTGFGALGGNTTGSGNTATGVSALRFGNANNCSAFGLNTLPFNVGDDNTAMGNGALYTNSTGFFNTAIGSTSLVYNTTGAQNTAVGYAALHYNNNGSYNTAVGFGALASNISAYYNTALGYSAGDTYNNGYNNVFLGAETDVNSAGYYNVVAVGHETICTASSQARIGNSFTTSIGGYANWSNISDVRVKKNIKQNVPGLAFINKLQPITYNLDLSAADKIIQPPAMKDKDGKQIQPTQQDLDARKAKEQIVYTGFAAQDVEKAAKSLNYDFSGVDAAKNNKDLYGLRYAEFVVPLVKAVQELSQQNDSLKNELNELKAMIISNQSSAINSQSQTAITSSGSLQQNVPNPFSNSTTIHYTLPQQYSSAKIIVTDKNGNALKQISLSNKGNGSVIVDASTLSSGAYQYSLIVDGRVISSKQMLIAK